MNPTQPTTDYRLNTPQIVLIGFGFLASSLAWSIYNSQVPLILSQRFFLSNALIGMIMTIDNFFGVIFQPLVGTWSDNTHTRFGRRMPWVFFGLPASMFVFSMIPLQNTLLPLMTAVIAFNLLMSLWRSPIISLMPDITPQSLRSQANGIINLMGGIGAILAFVIGGPLSDLREDKFFTFFFGSAVLLIALLVLFFFVREPYAILHRRKHNLPVSDYFANRWAQQTLDSHPEQKPEETPEKIRLTIFLTLPKERRQSLYVLLFAIFTWFMGFNAIETFFTLFATNTFGITGGQATMMLAGFSLSFLLFSIPAGFIGQRIGRNASVRIGLLGNIFVFLLILVHPVRGFVQIMMVIGGAFWAMINTNSLPMVLDFASAKSFGSFTGTYYLFSFSASIVSPILYGALQDRMDTYRWLFAYGTVFLVIALGCMLFVRHGDAEAK